MFAALPLATPNNDKNPKSPPEKQNRTPVNEKNVFMLIDFIHHQINPYAARSMIIVVLVGFKMFCYDLNAFNS